MSLGNSCWLLSQNLTKENSGISACCISMAYLRSASFFLLSCFLALITLVVVAGNLLVVLASLTNTKLKDNITNIFIVSLAMSDLLLGTCVLPFSVANQVLMKQWLFGHTLCRAWLAIDVWCCTASILNLVIISMDRYFAIRYPIKYPKLVTRRNARIMVTFVWLLAFLISFPPLMQLDAFEYAPRSANTSQSKCNVSNSSQDQCLYLGQRCSISSSTPAYIVYSALGSFFLPMAVMTYFYAGIFLTVRRTLNSMRTGQLIMRSSGCGTNSGSGTTMTLRVHCGGYVNNSHPEKISTSRSFSLEPQSTPFSPEISERRRFSTILIQNFSNWLNPSAANRRGSSFAQSATSRSNSLVPPVNSRRNSLAPIASSSRSNSLVPPGVTSRNNSLTPSTGSRSGSLIPGASALAKSFSRFNRETKAARMLAIIGGAFIGFWMPFFTVYLIGGFCQGCVSEGMFDLFFWLGYGNSLVNPIIYALMSRDFREAFRALLCRRRNRGPVSFHLVVAAAAENYTN